MVCLTHLEHTVAVDQEVAWLDVSVKNTSWMKVFQSWLGWYREWEKNRRGCYIRCHIYQWLSVIFMSLQSWNTKYTRQHINTLSCFFSHAVGGTLEENTFSSHDEVEKKIKQEKEQIIPFTVCEILSCTFIDFLHSFALDYMLFPSSFQWLDDLLDDLLRMFSASCTDRQTAQTTLS